MVARHWFWYGDKYFINAMIIWWSVSLELIPKCRWGGGFLVENGG